MGLSTHILDTSLGRPAANVSVKLFEYQVNVAGGAWEHLSSGFTDSDGRCKTLLTGLALRQSIYKIIFETESYFQDLHTPTLYPYIDIAFTIADPAQHYHIPLLLTANGYTTYRGS